MAWDDSSKGSCVAISVKVDLGFVKNQKDTRSRRIWTDFFPVEPDPRVGAFSNTVLH